MVDNRQSRTSSEKAKQQRLPRASTSKIPSILAVAGTTQESPCCSEGNGEVVLVCCDSPACAGDDDVTVCSPAVIAAAAADDCVECQRAVSTGCTEDCVIGGPQSSVDCPECAEEHHEENITTTEKKSNNIHRKVGKVLSAADAFDAEEPIQACDVPGCGAIEWDEKAVDELLRCCCTSSEHHHQSFAIPSSHTSSNSINHVHLPSLYQHQHTHTNQLHHVETQQHQQHQPPHQHNSHQAFPANVHQAFHAHHHWHAEEPFPSHQSHSFARPDSATSSITLQNSSTSDFSSPFLHAHNYTPASFPSLPPSTASNNDLQKSHWTEWHQDTHTHARTQSLPVLHQQQQQQQQQQQLPPPTAQSLESAQPAISSPVFRCQWSACPATFSTREELVGHVTVTHLLHVEATTQDEAKPAAAAQPASVNKNGITFSNTHANMNVQPNLQSQAHALAAQKGTTNQASIFGEHLHNQPTDDSFDHTLRCLWDSCEASLPVLGGPLPVLAADHAQHGQVSANGSINEISNQHVMGNSLTASNTAMHHLPDQSTASLVRHLLQDHLHLPTDVLGQLSPALPLPTNTETSQSLAPNRFTSLSNVTSVPTHSQSGSISADNTPQTSYRHSAGPSPATFRSLPPTPPLAPADQKFRFDFGLQDMTNVQSWSMPQVSLPDPIVPASNNGQKHDGQDETKITHACQWKGCSVSFANTADLMDHISSEHIGSGKSAYYCEWDGCERAKEERGFSQRQKVMRHVRTHVGDKPFLCSECGKAFSESTTLAQHMRTHTNEKPFECPEPGCGKTFALQSALTIHMRMHTGEKPFRCPHPGCDMAFAESSNLSKHVKTHLHKAGIASQQRNVGSFTKGRKRRYTSATDLEESDYLDGAAKVLRA